MADWLGNDYRLRIGCGDGSIVTRNVVFEQQAPKQIVPGKSIVSRPASEENAWRADLFAGVEFEADGLLPAFKPYDAIGRP